MIGATSRTTAAASTPRSVSDLSRFTTRNARPSTAGPSRTASACSRCFSRSERSRSAPPESAFVSATTTPPSLRRTTTSASASGARFRSFRARSSSARSSSASCARAWSSAHASPEVTASIRRAPAPTELSPSTTNGPISAVERTCVPPQSSRE